MSSIKKKWIITFVPDEWSDSYQTRHHLMISLSEFYNIIWVSNPKSFLTHGLSFSMKLEKTQVLGLEVLNLKFPMALTFKDFNRPIINLLAKALNKTFSRIYLIMLKRKIKTFLIKDPIIYVWRPEFFQVASGLFKNVTKCYHIDDEYSFNLQQDLPVSRFEKAALRNSDVVFIHSKSLMEKKGRYNSNSIMLPNAVSSSSLKPSEKLISTLKVSETLIFESRRPVIGYVGQIKRQLDFELLFQLVNKLPQYNFVFIGKIKKQHKEVNDGWSRIEKFQNVHYLGEKKSSELAYYIQKFDVAIMPYLNNVYTKYIFPLKLYEYMASGCQIISTNLPNLKEYGEFIFLNDDIVGWKKSINDILEQGRVKKESQALVECASQNTWESRAEVVYKELSAYDKK